MSDQLSMFGARQQPMPAHNGTETSKEAATAIRETASELRERVFEFIAEQGWDGATDEEIQEALRMEGNTQRPRRVELSQAKRIMQHGKRKTRSGRSAAVWVRDPGLRGEQHGAG